MNEGGNDVQNNAMLVVRRPGRGSRKFLRQHAARQPGRFGGARSVRLSGRPGGRRADRGIHAGGPILHRAQRRRRVQVHRGGLLPDLDSGPGRNRPAYQCAFGGAGGRTMRLGEGQIRPVLANRAGRADPPPRRSG